VVSKLLQRANIGTATERLQSSIIKKEQYGKIFKMSGDKYLFSIFELTHSIKINNNFINIHKISGNSFTVVLIF
jgi:hypothetical protein